MLYKNTITGEVWSLDEIKLAYNQFENETNLSFEDTMKDFEEVNVMATMKLYNKKTGEAYGYFGTPYPTIESAIQMCFPDADPWNDSFVDGPDGEEIWLDELDLGFDDEPIEEESKES